MRVSLGWLREFVEVAEAPRTLADRLTMAGLELEVFDTVAPAFSGVVVASIVECEPHPAADRLRICRVDAGSGASLQVVCGASNARVGLFAPLANVGATVGERRIDANIIRGVESRGMLCSARELGLGSDADGLLELGPDAVPGTALETALALDDVVLELAITANRGDCLSMLGVAREVAVLTGHPLHNDSVVPAVVRCKDSTRVDLASAKDCPIYLGRRIRGLDANARTPTWLGERLRRAGLRCVHPVVDVTNYVMLEFGQPLHAYDAGRLQGAITARHAVALEPLVLLDGRRVELDESVLVIADEGRALGIAGVMGGLETAVSGATTDVFLESAWFRPEAIAGRARRFGVNSDAAQRFERGVDSTGQRRSLERATQLLQFIAGGHAGPVTEAVEASSAPTARAKISLRASRLAEKLGMEVQDTRVEGILRGLGMEVERASRGWEARSPAWRFDIEREEDLIEEVGRIHGYERVPVVRHRAAVAPLAMPERRANPHRFKQLLADRGFDEVVTYSFVNPELQLALCGVGDRPRLLNPISADLIELRTSLLPGLLTVARYNLDRQQERVRLFEQGVRYTSQLNEIKEETVLAAFLLGSPAPAQWGLPTRSSDFADAKADVEAILGLACPNAMVAWKAVAHPALHPGQTASVSVDGARIGVVGSLHPRLVKAFDLRAAPVYFELCLADLAHTTPRAVAPSRFPQVRRDLAVVVDDSVEAAVLLDAVRDAGGASLASVEIFDVYRGKGIDSGRKSIAMTLILQDSSRTLTDEKTEVLMQRVAAELAGRCGASIRV